MSRLYLQPTSIAQWHALVNEAELSSAVELGEDLESYLVFLLMRFAEKPEMAKSILALEFLESLQIQGSERSNRLQDVGDKCLLYSGLFPERAQRRRLQERYFIDLGQNAYYILATLSDHQTAELFHAISNGFISMKDVLTAMRTESAEFKNWYRTLGEIKKH